VIFGHHSFRKPLCAGIGLVFAAAVGLAAAAGGPRVREQKTVVVDAVREMWRLEWQDSPTSACGPDFPEISLTCPCSGFAYGEQGRLALVRIRSGKVIERLALDRFFISDELPVAVGPAVLERWPPSFSHDFNVGDHDAQFMREVAARRPADVMSVADYDHDGHATEFLLQVGTLPCGKQQMVLVGISKRDPHLHVFSSVERPSVPLVLGAWQWKQLLESHGTVKTIEWPCGDHGSEKEWTDTLTAHDGFIDDFRMSRTCGRDEHPMMRRDHNRAP
jgi:hypothetical protein